MAPELRNAATTTETCEFVVNILGKEFSRISGRNEQETDIVVGSIHKVPHFLREGNEGDYTPKLMSIGPYHHCGNENLVPMEDVKLNYLLDFTRRTRRDLQSCVRDVEELADRARKEYSAGVSLDHKEFLKMMVVDCCFILEFLMKWFCNEKMNQKNVVLTKINMLKNDLLLVENQVPFFLLDHLFVHCFMGGEMIGENVPKDFNLTSIALAFFMGDRDDARLAEQHLRFTGKLVFHHLLHLYHASLESPPLRMGVSMKLSMHLKFISSRIRKILSWIIKVLIIPTLYRPYSVVLKVSTGWIVQDPQPKVWFSGIPNARNLRESGFSFQKKYAKEYSYFTFVSHHGNTIKIPAICIRERTRLHFKNLIAFEQCSANRGNRFTAYAMFMDYLIDTAEDVALLKESGIIDNRLGDDQKVADFFNNLRKGIHLDHDGHYLSPIFDHVTKYYTRSYYKIRVYRWRKKFIPDYFTNPWAIPSMIAALIILLLTGLQTFYTVYSYYRPHVLN